MNQLSEEQQEQVKQIRERIDGLKRMTLHGPVPLATTMRIVTYADDLLSLLDSDSQAAAHDPFPPVTDTGRGRCRHNVPTCGECQIGEVLAHVKDKEQVASDAATAMRDKCVEKMKVRLHDPSLKFFDDGARAVVIDWTNYLIREIQSLTLDQVKPEKP